MIQLWTVCQESAHEEEPPHRTVKFSVGLSDTGKEETVQPEHEREIVWATAWRCKYVLFHRLFLLCLVEKKDLKQFLLHSKRVRQKFCM